MAGTTRPVGRATMLLGCLAFGVVGALTSWAESAPIVTAVAAHASNSYVRSQLPDGEFKPEFYAFGEGGRWDGPMIDLSFDKLTFLDVAQAIAPPLETQNYLPAKDPAKAKLLIMVYWGLTAGTAGGASSSIAMQRSSGANQGLAEASQNRAVVNAASGRGNSRGVYLQRASLGSNWGTYDYNPFPPGGLPSSNTVDVFGAMLDQQAAQGELDAALLLNAVENRQRDQQNLKNASMLGYDSELAAASTLDFSALRNRHQDALDEIEENRYFVVLMAYDFQQIARNKKHVLLWETRFSIRQQGNDFDKKLATMANYAARYFGQNTNGLVHKHDLKENIKLHETKFIGEVPDKK